MSTPIKNKKYICHLTALRNLESIVNRGLLPRNQLQEGQFVDTANHDILQGRTQFHLGDFVPFHFDYHTAYDKSVKKTHRDIEFIYLCVNRSNASKMGFLVLPIHPTSTNAVSPLPYDKGFDAIDWNTMEMNKGKCNDENYRTQVRMAECIHEGTLNISDIDFIICRTDKIKNKIIGIFNNYQLQNRPGIMVNANFFEDLNL